MNGMVVEIIVTAFTLGGIIGAAAALSLKSSRLWRKAADSAGTMSTEKPDSQKQH